MAAAVFADGEEFFRLLRGLVRRPGRGELPEDVPSRDGLPVVRLVGDEQADLADSALEALARARPGGVPHESIDVPALWARVQEVEDLRRDGEGWPRAEMYRRMLVRLAEEFSSARNTRDTRVRFRRFGLVNWLLESTHEREGLEDPHERRLLVRLRDRELRRGRLWAAPSNEVSLREKVPWWGLLLALYVVPAIWFRAWLLLGAEYRWLRRQPFMAPRDPGTSVGFALRLAQPRREREDPDELGRLMINAFLEDLRVAYRRRFWRRRAWRRTAYCVALLKGSAQDNPGDAFIDSLVDVRNKTGVFDPLLVIAGTPRAGYRGPDPEPRAMAAYDLWKFRFESAKRSRRSEDWYLTLEVPAPVPETDDRHARLRQRVEQAKVIPLPRVPAWAGRRVTGGAVLAVVAALGATAFSVVDGWGDFEREHCGLGGSDPDARTVKRQATGECTGIAPHGFAFGAPDADLRHTLETIARQNEEAEEIHGRRPERPVVTLVHMSALLGGAGRQYAREALQGTAIAQRRQLDKRGDTDPVLRIFPASAGSGMAFGPEVVGVLARMAREDPTIVGVTGLDQSRQATITTIKALTRIGLPMVATTLSADGVDDQSPLYYQVSPQNHREAAVGAAYAAHLAESGEVERKVRVLYSADPTDEYSKNLREDADRSFAAAGFEVEGRSYVPAPAPEGVSGDGARGAGEAACGYDGLVFFAGRSEDFAKVLEGTNDVCGSTPPTLFGGDDVALFAADAELRRTYPRVPFDFLDFTLGSASCDSPSDLYSTMKVLFPDECAKLPNSSLDGHAALAFDAVNLYLKAIGQLQDTAPGLPLTPSGVWHGLSSIHGKAALDGESGQIDFGGLVDQQIPVDKLISVQRVDGQVAPTQVGFCGRRGEIPQSAWCPPLVR